MRLKTGLMTFGSDEEFSEGVTCIRGFFASKFTELDQLHNHNTDKFIYRYPLVQYKFLENKPYLLGINEGVGILKEIFDEFEVVTLNGQSYEISERIISIKKQAFGISSKIHFYEFMTPWLALNERNYQRYSSANNNEERVQCLRENLIGNMLSMSKGIGYTVPDTIKCDIDLVKLDTEYKGNKFISFRGSFMANFEIPDYFGIGKSVSKGYGTLQKIDKCCDLSVLTDI